MSQKHERARHEALARSTASWQSWAVEGWFFNTNMAFMLPEPFRGPAMRLDFECMCDLTRRRTHENDLSRFCVFVDSYQPDPKATALLTKVLTRSSRHRGNRIVEIDRSAEYENEAGIVSYRVPVPGEDNPRAWLAVQKIYVDAVERHARPDRWAWFQLPPNDDGSAQQPMVWALRGTQGVGLISPMTCPGSAIEAAPIDDEATP